MANMYTKTPSPGKELLETLYHKEFKSQLEIAVVFGTTQKVVYRWFRDLGIKSRVPYKRNQRGSNNSSWKGDNVSYAAFHYRVQKARGKANKCEVCGTETGRIEWANLTGNYNDVVDYKMMCVSCHHKHDGHINNFLNRRVRPLINKRKIIDGK